MIHKLVTHVYMESELGNNRKIPEEQLDALEVLLYAYIVLRR